MSLKKTWKKTPITPLHDAPPRQKTSYRPGKFSGAKKKEAVTKESKESDRNGGKSTTLTTCLEKRGRYYIPGNAPMGG